MLDLFKLIGNDGFNVGHDSMPTALPVYAFGFDPEA
jgi:hypothetical protein